MSRTGCLLAALLVLTGCDYLFDPAPGVPQPAVDFVPIRAVTPRDFGEANSEACAILRFGLVACGLSVLAGRLASGSRVRDP